MPSLNDVVEVANALDTAAVVAMPDRCVKVRNRNSQCSRCEEVCFSHAIDIKLNSIAISGAQCVSCGSCVAVCPTQALVPLEPTAEQLAARVAAAQQNLGKPKAVIACARMEARHIADPDMYAVVPCLGRIEETSLLEIAAAGAEEMVLVDGTCATCKYRDVVPAVDATLACARSLRNLMGSKVLMSRMSDFPLDIPENPAKAVGASRRSFFTDAKAFAQEAAIEVAEKTVLDSLGMGRDEKVASIRERLKVSQAGKMPQFSAERTLRLMDAMCQLGPAPRQDTLQGRDFGSVSIDVERCTGCGMCVMFCPTDALNYSEVEPQNDETRLVEFSMADCTQCMLCADACMAKCIEVSDTVETAELFDFEPRLLEIGKARPNPQLFGRK